MSAREVVCPDCDDPTGLVVVELVERHTRLDGLAVAGTGSVARGYAGWADVIDGTDREVALACRTCGWRSAESAAPGHVDRIARRLAATTQETVR